MKSHFSLLAFLIFLPSLNAQIDNYFSIGLHVDESVLDISHYGYSVMWKIKNNDCLRFRIDPKFNVEYSNYTRYYYSANISCFYLIEYSLGYFNLFTGPGIEVDSFYREDELLTLKYFGLSIPYIIGITRDISKYVAIGLETGAKIKYTNSKNSMQTYYVNYFGFEFIDISLGLFFHVKK